MKKFKLTGLALMAVLSLTSCNNDDDSPEPIHDHEGVHELVIQRTDLDGGNPIEYEFEAGNAVGETINLSANSAYNLEVIELNAHHEDHEHNILDEVLEAVEEHFFLYNKSEELNLELVRVDEAESTRNDGIKIGVKTRIDAGDASTGVLEINLKHQPTSVDDSANGGWGSATGGATDVQALFPVVIE